MIDKTNEKLDILILRLKGRLGRFPTEEEITSFINGNEEERNAIWNKEVNRQKEKQDGFSKQDRD